jgi:hypothetical protein
VDATPDSSIAEAATALNSVQPISTESVTAQNGASTILGYRLTRSFEIRSQRVAAMAVVAEDGARLLTGGVPLTAQPLQYVYTHCHACARHCSRTRPRMHSSEPRSNRRDGPAPRQVARSQRRRLPGDVTELDAGQRLRHL